MNLSLDCIFAGLDLDMPTWPTTCMMNGTCMPLVVVLIQPSLAKGTTSLLLTMVMQNRYIHKERISCFRMIVNVFRTVFILTDSFIFV